MKPLWLVALFYGFCWSLPAASEGMQKYAQGCADCHGRKADRVAFGKAPPLISLSREQLVSALTDRRDGKIPTSGAEQRVKQGLSDEDIQGLADYIRSLTPVPAGDVTR